MKLINYLIHSKSICALHKAGIFTKFCLLLTLVVDSSLLSAQCDTSSQCTHSITLSDSYGDGWNGTELSVYQNNTLVGVLGAGFTASAGNPPGDTLVSSMDLCDSAAAYIVLSTGSTGAPYWSEEIGFTIEAPYGTVVASYSNGINPSQGDTLAVIYILCTAPSCLPPTALSAYSTGSSTADILWTTGGAANWEVEYGNSGFTLGAGTRLSTSNDTVSMTGLTTNWAYDFYVRDSCGANDLSQWAGPYRFGSDVVACDSFDLYQTGPVLNRSYLFKSWRNIYAGGEISSDYSNSGNNSLKMDNADGLLVNYADIGLHTSGVWNIEFDVYIPTGKAAYYNIMYNYTAGPGISWGPVVNLNATGMASIVHGNNNNHTLGSFSFNHGSWNHIENIIDLDNDSIFLKVNGVVMPGWKFSLDTAAFGNQFNVINFAAFQPDHLAYYDNLCVSPYTASSSCLPPTGLQSNALNTATSELSWNGGGASAWQIEYGPSGFGLGNGTKLSVTSPLVQISGLMPNVKYEFYVRDSCAAGNVSAWVGPVYFGGVVENCDNFEAYQAGLLDPQSNLFEGWLGNGGDSEVSTEVVAAGQHALKIHNSGPSGISDVVANMGSYTSGGWKLSFEFYLPAGKNAAYNLIHRYPLTANADFAFFVWLKENGYLVVQDDAFGAQDSVAIIHDSWHIIDHIINLDQDSISLYLDGNLVKSWQFSVNAGTFSNQFEALNMWSWGPDSASLAYYDNFCLMPYSFVGLEETKGLETKVYPNPSAGIYQVELAHPDDRASLDVLSVQGSRIRSLDFYGSTEIDISDEAKGVYFLRITSDAGIEMKRVIKN